MQEVDLKEKVVGEIVLPTIDIEKYIGQEAKIELVRELKGEYGYFIRLETGVIDTLEIKDADGKPVELVASRLFGLQTDAEGQIGWGESTKLDLYLKKRGVKHYRELIGITVKLQAQTSKEGKDYLSFN